MYEKESVERKQLTVRTLKTVKNKQTNRDFFDPHLIRFDLLIKSDREIWHSVTLFRLRLIIVYSLMSGVIIGRRNWFLGHLNWPQSSNSDIFRETSSIFCFITAEPRLTGHLQSVDNSRLGGHLKAGGHPFRELTHPVGWEVSKL